MTQTNDATADLIPLTEVTVNATSGQLVLTSATGEYDIDLQHGVIHCNVNPPAKPQNGGPNFLTTFVLRGHLPQGQGVAFVGLIFIGETSTSVYKFAYNMNRLEEATEDLFSATRKPVTNLRISSQRQSTLVATAATGEYLSAPDLPSQVIAIDAINEPGKQLVKGELYAIAGTGIQGSRLNLQFDHITHATNGHLFVFFEVLAADLVKQAAAGGEECQEKALEDTVNLVSTVSE